MFFLCFSFHTVQGVYKKHFPKSNHPTYYYFGKVIPLQHLFTWDGHLHWRQDRRIIPHAQPLLLGLLHNALWFFAIPGKTGNVFLQHHPVLCERGWYQHWKLSQQNNPIQSFLEWIFRTFMASATYQHCQVSIHQCYQ